jgi:flagellar hook-basal body complex protein FliE
MSIAVSSLQGVSALQGVTPTSYLPSADSTTSTTGASFATSLAGAVDDVQQLQGQSQTLAVQAVTGNLDDIHTATIAATRAQVTLELVAAVRNKGIDAFNEIMKMQA